MKAIQFNDSIPRYLLTRALGPLFPGMYTGPLACLGWRDVPEPRLPGPRWVKIRVKYGGICGSDLELIRLADSPSTSPFASFPFTVGHENTGTIAEVGPLVKGFKAGDRVVADPLLPCAAREVVSPCPACVRGDFSLCENFQAGPLAPGLEIGTCRDTGGSWSSCFVAHESQLFHLPDNVSDENAVMVDPFSSALHAVARNRPEDSDTVLIQGMGTIGLCAILSLKALGSKARIVVLARHRFQGELAKGFGADEVVYASKGDDYFAELAKLFGAKLYQPILGKRIMVGGAGVVYECVGSDTSIDEALRFTQSGGTMVLVGLASIPKGVDWTPIWFNEVRVRGSFCCSTEEYEGRRMRTYALALRWMAEGKADVSGLITHRFPLRDYRAAIGVSLSKARSKAVKTIFTLEG
jgi:threonine dehydrogenase-like Zn-dependent dehydrogenase